jgi:hypothetical protein
MYARREQIYRMQTLSRPNSTDGLSPQAHTVAIVAILLFAFSGLLSGFAVGAFIRVQPSSPSRPNFGATSVVQKGQTPTTVPTRNPVKLGWPVVDEYKSSEVADGHTIYTVSAYAVDRSIDKGHGKQIHATGITCVFWLTKDQKSPEKNLSPINAVNNQMDGELAGALHFDSATPRVQSCNANGSGTWRYTIDPSVPPGDYYLAVVTDWNALYYNWSWREIHITNQNH